MPVSFAKNREAAEKAGLVGGGDYLKLKNGPNRLRLISNCLAHPGEFNGRKTFKWLCYVIDRADGKVRAFFMPHVIYKQIEALQVNPDYEFDDVPMPYDLTITVTNAGTKEAKYLLVPARKNTPITDAEFEDFGKQKPLEELQAAINDKRAKSEGAQPHDEDDERREHDAVFDDPFS